MYIKPLMQDTSVSLSNELASLIRSHNRILTIGYDYTITRCCNAVRIIAGRLCAPHDHTLWEYREDFEKIIIGDISVFIQQPLLQNDEIEFTIPDIGVYSVRLDKK